MRAWRDASVPSRGYLRGPLLLGLKAAGSIHSALPPRDAQPGNSKPHVAPGGVPEALRLAIQALRAFRLACREAWNRFKQGLHAVFPGGTLLVASESRDVWQRRFGEGMVSG